MPVVVRTKPTVREAVAVSYLYETHFHTAETSWCGNVPAAEGVRAYREQGYSGIVVTDHYFDGIFDRIDAASWEDKLDIWLQGWRAAVAAGQKEGIAVFLGMELRFAGHSEDYLVYGVSESFLREHPRLYAMTEAAFSRLAREQGLFFGQAHPFRPGLTRCDPALLDGVEVFNGNLRHNSHDDDALAFARENGLIETSGSDFHEWEDLARGGMASPEPVRDERDWVRRLKDRTLKPLFPAG